MENIVANTTKVSQDTPRLLNDDFIITPAVTEPFQTGRSASRLLFDFSVMASLFNPVLLKLPILDFGAGSGWVSEFCARMGFQVVSFDTHGDLKNCLENRVQADQRLDKELLSFAHGDGHSMPFSNNVFGHLLCYDTLHHMYDYPKVFMEFYRVLKEGGRAIFVEPGAHHSTSPDTIAFVEAQKKHDPSWIERDVVLEEINQIVCDAGFIDGITIVPMPHPSNLQTFSLQDWTSFRQGDRQQHLRVIDTLGDINYYNRIIFYIDKPSNSAHASPSKNYNWLMKIKKIFAH